MRLYTIKELEEIVGRTSATLYAYMRSDAETKDFFANHRQERTKGGYLYDDDVLLRLKNRFSVEDSVGQGDYEAENPENPQTKPLYQYEIEALTAELEDLKGKYNALQADFARVDGERAELLKQNGLQTEQMNHLLLLLSLEKQEKQALLPQPRKTIGERIRNLFKRPPVE